MRPEIPSVNQRRHAHCNDEPRRTRSEEPLWETVLPVLEGDTRTHDLLDERLEKGWHGPVPQRKDDDEMLRRNDGSLGLEQAFRKMTCLELLFRPQNGEVETRHVNTRHFISGSRCTLCIDIGERVCRGGYRQDRDDLG